MGPGSYYVSNYLRIAPSLVGTSLLFNGFTGAIDEVSLEFGEHLSRLKTGGCISDEDLNFFSEPEIHFLMDRGHITPLDKKQEIEKFCLLVNEIHKYVKENVLSIGYLLLIPSYNCNLTCPYCFEQDIRSKNPKIMSPEQVDRLFLSNLPKIFPTVKDITKISVDLYGGEAFLEPNHKTIERILYYTQKNKMKVSAVSNGTQVDKMLDFFGTEIGLVGEIQVTLDGGKEHHDKSRIGPNGEPTFDKIIKNVHQLVSKNISVTIRINCQKETMSSLTSLMDRLNKEGLLGNQHVTCYVWPVHSNYVTTSCANLEHKQLAEFIRKYNLKLDDSIDRWKKTLKRVCNATSGLPLQRTVYCMKCKPNSFAYDASESLYLCYDECGRKSKRCGYIDGEGQVVFLKEYYDSYNRVVSAIEKCKECNLALLCGGGCAAEAERYNGTMYSPGCGSFAECFDAALAAVYKEKMAE